MPNLKHIIFCVFICLTIIITPPAFAIDSKIPILFVHGWFGASYVWNTLIPKLVDLGYDRDMLYTISIGTDNSQLCSRAHVPQIAYLIEQIVVDSGYSEIDVVGQIRHKQQAQQQHQH